MTIITSKDIIEIIHFIRADNTITLYEEDSESSLYKTLTIDEICRYVESNNLYIHHLSEQELIHTYYISRIGYTGKQLILKLNGFMFYTGASYTKDSLEE